MHARRAKELLSPSSPASPYSDCANTLRGHCPSAGFTVSRFASRGYHVCYSGPVSLDDQAIAPTVGSGRLRRANQAFKTWSSETTKLVSSAYESITRLINMSHLLDSFPRHRMIRTEAHTPKRFCCSSARRWLQSASTAPATVLRDVGFKMRPRSRCRDAPW